MDQTWAHFTGLWKPWRFATTKTPFFWPAAIQPLTNPGLLHPGSLWELCWFLPPISSPGNYTKFWNLVTFHSCQPRVAPAFLSIPGPDGREGGFVWCHGCAGAWEGPWGAAVPRKRTFHRKNDIFWLWDVSQAILKSAFTALKCLAHKCISETSWIAVITKILIGIRI